MEEKKCWVKRSEEIVDCFDWSSDNGRRKTIRRAHYTTELNTDFRRFCSLLLTLLGLDRSPSLSALANTQQIQFINRYLEETTAILLSEQYLYRCRNGERAHVWAHTAHSSLYVFIWPVCYDMFFGRNQIQIHKTIATRSTAAKRNIQESHIHSEFAFAFAFAWAWARVHNITHYIMQ